MPKKKTHEEFVNEVYALVKDEYSVLGEYINYNSKIKIKHNVCGTVWDVRVSHFKHDNTRCPKCSRLNNKNKTHEEYLNELKLFRPKVKVLESYKGSLNPILHRCECNGTWYVAPANVLMGTQCKKCGIAKMIKTQSKSHVEYIKSLYKINNKIKVIQKYINLKTKIQHKCECGNDNWMVRPSDVLSGCKCSVCSGSGYSKGSTYIENILKNNNINYKCEYKFVDCKYKNQLPFDFAIFKDNNLFCLIEFDGIQHYQKTGWDKSEDKLERTIKCDKIKTQYCFNNNVKLIRIPYWEQDNIKIILHTELRDLITN